MQDKKVSQCWWIMNEPAKSYPLVLSFPVCLFVCVCLCVLTVWTNFSTYRQSSLASSSVQQQRPIETKPPRIPVKSPLNNGMVHPHRQTHHQSIQQQGIKIRDDPEIAHESTRSLRSSMKTPDFCNSVDYEPTMKPAKQHQPDTKNQRPVPKPRRSIQQRRSSYLRSRSVEIEPSEAGHNFSVYQRINIPSVDPLVMVMAERNTGWRRTRADDVTIPPRRSSSLAPTPSPRKNINAKLVSRPAEIDRHPSHHPVQRRASVSEHRPDTSRRMSRASSVCRIKTEPLLYNSQGHPNVQPRHSSNQPPHSYQPSTYNTSSSVIVSRAEESLLNRSQSNSRKQRFSR